MLSKDDSFEISELVLSLSLNRSRGFLVIYVGQLLHNVDQSYFLLHAINKVSGIVLNLIIIFIFAFS